MRRPESFTDKLARLFPVPDIGPHGVNSPHSKDITFQVTEDCNLCCTYCYQGNKSHHAMTFETAKQVIDMLLAADSRTNQYITTTQVAGVVLDFIGGEPFLEVGLIDRIMDYWIEQTFLLCHPLATRYMISISTNGTLYFRPEVQRFISKWRDHLSLSISIDGNKELHDSCRLFPDGRGSYDLAIEAARHYMSQGGELGSKMTIAPGNVRFLRDAVLGLLGAGYTAIYCNCVYEEGWTISHARELYTQLRALADDLIAKPEQPYISIFDPFVGHPMPPEDNQNWCGGDGRMLAIDWQGRFYPCLRYMGSSLGGAQPPYVIGDLETGIMGTEEQRDRVKALEEITRRSQSSDECWNCPIASGCSWCSAYNYQCTGSPNRRTTYICPMHKARVMGNAYYWNRLLREKGIGRRYALDIPADWAKEIIGSDEYDCLCDLSKEV